MTLTALRIANFKAFGGARQRVRFFRTFRTTRGDLRGFGSPQTANTIGLPLGGAARC